MTAVFSPLVQWAVTTARKLGAWWWGAFVMFGVAAVCLACFVIAELGSHQVSALLLFGAGVFFAVAIAAGQVAVQGTNTNVTVPLLEQLRLLETIRQSVSAAAAAAVRSASANPTILRTLRDETRETSVKLDGALTFFQTLQSNSIDQLTGLRHDVESFRKRITELVNDLQTDRQQTSNHLDERFASVEKSIYSTQEDVRKLMARLMQPAGLDPPPSAPDDG